MNSETMQKIIARDPDGGNVMPTDADYQAFEDWIIKRYGQTTLAEYRGRSEDTPYEPWGDC